MKRSLLKTEAETAVNVIKALCVIIIIAGLLYLIPLVLATIQAANQ